MAKKPHRRLTLASPVESGEDVTGLQEALDRRYNHFRIDKEVARDGEFGKQSFQATKEIAIAMGAGRENLKALKAGRASVSVQSLIRGTRKKTRWERVLASARSPYRKKLRKRYDKTSGQKVMAWAKKQVGTTESPAGSNWGPQIGEWIKYTGYTGPVFWCGCFACYGVCNIGKAKIPVRIRLGYTGYITADANAGVNGLTAVPFSSARAGDIVVYSFDHIGLVDRVDGDTLYTVEGNTSSGSSGSQSNGGGVFARVRSRADVVTIARPNY